MFFDKLLANADVRILSWTPPPSMSANVRFWHSPILADVLYVWPLSYLLGHVVTSYSGVLITALSL